MAIDWGRIIETGIALLVIPFLVWNGRTVGALYDTVFGPNGGNGLRGTVKHIEVNLARLDVHHLRLEALERRLTEEIVNTGPTHTDLLRHSREYTDERVLLLGSKLDEITRRLTAIEDKLP